MATCNWGGYEFTIYEMATTTWNDVGGVYIFSGEAGSGRWAAWYIGQCDSFMNRCPTHERWVEAIQRGATHVHALVVPLEANRLAIEKQLIQTFQPPLNTHHM